MFPRRSPWAALVVGVLVLLLLSGIASSMQRNAWMQGYLAGQMTAGADGGKLAPAVPYLYGGYGGFPGPHFGFGGFWLVGLLFLFFVGLRFLRGWGWRHCPPHNRYPGQGGAPEDAPGSAHSRYRGHRPPWWGWEEDAQHDEERSTQARGEPGRA